MKTHNYYAERIGAKLYAATPKAVFAAIAASALTTGGDYIERAGTEILREWWCLYDNQIVPQKPPFPRPIEHAESEGGAV